MASSGRWGIETTDAKLEVVRSVGNHFCCGAYNEEDKIVRSAYCAGVIRPKDLYCRNQKAPSEVLFLLRSAHGGGYLPWPTCLPCVLHAYPSTLTGEPIDRLLAIMEPVTEETRLKATEALQEAIRELAA